MLQIPEKDFKKSVNVSNVGVTSLGDWLEACLLFSSDRVSKNDVVDLLIEEQVCDDDSQDLAYQIATNGWDELSRRQRWGGLSLEADFTRDRLTRRTTWEDDLFSSFMVLLSLFKIFPEWAAGHRDFVGQGDLFERCTELICPALLPGWKTYRAGWTPEDAKNIPGIVDALCELLFTSGAADLNEWIAPQGNDGGLDLVCYKTFGDEREGMPVFFLQCASGKNWRDKIHTPNGRTWQKYLNAAVMPSTGIIAPFVIESAELKRASLEGQAIVFDRLRLLSAKRENPIELPDELANDLKAWMQVRVDALPIA
ncbi:hypothetical protein [Psychromarinibacter halotolerans]|uniref:Restriction endonuclease n=1 Tax=Psychromarinibacter halotolerans TaxID=1775175 RepID=A0ABV7GVN3_9RHOB|nr:hypothetical protein [Psychromarinibacter halotolerans]MDF0596313.1 hypothetical protein [Psychromarinibacter halotolerans]